MRKWLTLFVLFCLAGTAVLPSAAAAADQEDWLEFHEVQNADKSLTIEGLAIGSEGKEVTITLSTGDFETVNNRKVYKEILLSETRAAVNNKGYFILVTPPVDETKLKNHDLSIVLQNDQGKQAGNMRKFPIQVPAPNPDLFDKEPVDQYAKYKDHPLDAVSYDPQVLAMEGNRLAARIAAGDQASYVVDSAGTLWAWGHLPSSLTEPGSKSSDSTVWRLAKPVTSVKNVIQVAANGGAGAALTAEGMIWEWDYRGLTRIGKVADAAAVTVANDGNGLILKKDGTVYTWTMSAANEKAALSIKLAKAAGLQQIVKISAGSHSLYGNTFMALQRNGQVWAWGNMSIISSAKQASNKDRSNQSGLSKYMFEIVQTKIPELLSGIPAVRDMAFIEGYPVFITQNNEFWSYLDTGSTFVKKPGKVSGDAANVYNNVPYIQKKNGQYYRWYQGYSTLADEPETLLQGMKMVAASSSSTSNAGHMLGVQSDGTLMAWGANRSGQLGISAAVPIPSRPSVIASVAQPLSVSAGENHVLALNQKGALYGWGSNANQEIDGSGKPEILSPVRIATEGEVKKAAAGRGFSLYITNEGELYGWGDLQWLGMKVKTAAPVRISLVPEAVRDIDVTDRSAAVLTTTGKVYQLGGVAWAGVNAEVYVHNHYRQISGISDAVNVSMSGTRGYAVKKDGSVMFWSNAIVEGKTTAKTMAGLKNITALSAARANGEFLTAIDRQGGLWAWGDNSARQISYRMTQQLPSPMNITEKPIRITANEVTEARTKLSFRSVTASSNGALALTTSNEMLFMGYTASLLREGGLYRNVTFAEAQGSNMYWITGGKLYVYGYDNKSGQLGNGSKVQVDRPQRVLTVKGTPMTFK
ncbi:hypothetical protein Q5741_20615 [Paenibacillus sp. JX-17]|uniref:RCC1 repeat-containing protein n=1 Tax=Paenibacillus lacisoli TaxID=3064525 RepID=A0ABT9CHV8_9BACL|nr:RCC1 domain-containing protein [Paenibacillus sp. JX-17]MDO7908791.1 hypothetical protein [Paenibacillus sp. JX-17]